MARFGILLGVLSLTGCAHDGSSAAMQASLADLAPYAGQILGLFPVIDNGGVDVSAAQGVRFTVDEAMGTLTIELLDEAGPVAGPLVLSVDPTVAEGFVVLRSEPTTLFGASDVVVLATFGPVTDDDVLSITLLRGPSSLTGADPLMDHYTRRKAFIDHWNNVLRPDTSLCDAERLASMVQYVVDADTAVFASGPSLGIKGWILMDLADIFLPTDQQDTKWILFGGTFFGYQPIVVGAPYSALLPIAEPTYTGYAPSLQTDEGRHRHFVASALAASVDPTEGDLIAILAAAATGLDLETPLGRGLGSQADLKTNAYGREFEGWLEKAIVDDCVTGGAARQWILDRFANKPPEIAGFSIRHINGGSGLEFEVGAHDPEGQFLSYTWHLTGPAAGCGQFTVIGRAGPTAILDIEDCTAEDLAETVVMVIAKDPQGGEAMFSMRIGTGEVQLDEGQVAERGVLSDAYVAAENRPPDLLELKVELDQATHTYTVYAVDPDRGELTYEWSLSGPGAGCGTTSGNGTPSFSWNHAGCSPSDVQNTQITLTVRDANGRTTRYVQGARANEGTTVFNPDRPPPSTGCALGTGDGLVAIRGVAKNEFGAFGDFPAAAPMPGKSRLAAVAANPAILVGGKILHTFEPPPGVPPPPPPGPQPELVQAILALDLEGNELARLPLGDLGDAGLSCQLLSYNGASGRVDHFFIYGQVNFSSTVWNPDIPDFGAVSTSPNVKNVTDFSLYNGDQFGGGGVASWFQGQSLFCFEYNPSFGLFTQTETIDSSQFAGASGGPTSAHRWQAGGQTLFVTEGQPGELWSHPGTGTLAQTSTNATKIGNVGNGPRQIRFLGEIGVVSNFDSGTLTVVRRQSNGTVTILGTVTVGSGPIGLDLRLNSAGNIEVLSTGFNDHTYTLTVLSPTGAVIGTPKTRTVPEGGLNPVHAIFVNDAGTRICITCNGSGEILIFDLPTN